MAASLIIFTTFLLWLIVLSYVLYRITGHYNRLIGATGKTTLKEILDQLLDSQRQLTKEKNELGKKLNALEVETGFHIQRIGMVRFNPFSDTGGSQSFTLSLLDGHDNGIVMTSLYARTGNRWYVKEVRSGKGVEIELSKEERAAITKAKHVTDIRV